MRGMIRACLIAFAISVVAFAETPAERDAKIQASVNKLFQTTKKSERDAIIYDLHFVKADEKAVRKAIDNAPLPDTPGGAEGEAGTFVPKLEDHVKYRSYIPRNYKATAKFPLLLAIPDKTRNATQTVEFWKPIATECLIISPELVSGGWPLDPERLPVFYYLLRDAKKQFNVDDDRVYIAGFAAGADTAFSNAVYMPDCFAAAAFFSTNGPADAGTEANLSNMAVWISAGTTAAQKITKAADELGKKLTAAGSDCTISKPDGPGMTADEAKKAFAWMSGKVRKTSPSTIWIVMPQGVSQGSFYWLEADATYDKINVKAEAKGNIVQIKCPGVKTLTVYMDPGVMQLGKNMTVKMNGYIGYDDIPETGLKDMCESFFNSKDRMKIYHGSVRASTR